MKGFTVVCLFAMMAASLAAPGTKYTNKYDNINLDEILDNPRLLIPYLKCILDTGKCSSAGKELKSNIQDALETNCAKCTDVQRTQSRRVIAHIINHHDKYWKDLTAKYDPTRKYTQKYEAELRTVKAA